MKTSPADSFESAPALVAKALDKELNVVSPSKVIGSGANVVNDLSSLVVKKKKKAQDANSIQANGSSKRKLDEDELNAGDKRVKLDT